VACFHGAYRTFKTLQSSHARRYDFASGETMLQYWAVLSFLFIYEQYGEWAVFWLPLYYEAKMLLLLALLWRSGSAPRWMFDALLRPAITAGEGYLATRLLPRLHAAASRALRHTEPRVFRALVRSVRKVRAEVALA
jgi:hypothetical protein